MALRKRFTPVHIQSVQSSIFHERRQHVTESVDDYAQDLRKLFHRAYASSQEGGEAEEMGKSVLAYQFVAGLVEKLKAKIVGRTGTFEELLAQARFEEVRLKNIAPARDDVQLNHPVRRKRESTPEKHSAGEAPYTQPKQRQPRMVSVFPVEELGTSLGSAHYEGGGVHKKLVETVGLCREPQTMSLSQVCRCYKPRTRWRRGNKT